MKPLDAMGEQHICLAEGHKNKHPGLYKCKHVSFCKCNCIASYCTYKKLKIKNKTAKFRVQLSASNILLQNLNHTPADLENNNFLYDQGLSQNTFT